MDVPLSDDELDVLAERGLDLDHVLGVLHAVLIAPGMISLSRWLPLAFAAVPPDPKSIDLALRLYNQVGNLLRDGRVFVPAQDDDEGCVAFAAGYAAGAALDSMWIADTDRWTFAAPLAYLGERRDLVPPAVLADFDAHPEKRQVILRDLDRLVITTYSSFTKERVATARGSQARARATSVGRNEPCPCGSGQKYKRCCIDRPT
ncbi:MAG: SEC-C domain-containing protein [Myxococcales bacterium]|nr:SEC-C domain-containing protein [Myxococcales bacterium]